MENPIKMDDLGVPLFSETPMWPLGHMEGVFCSDKTKLTNKKIPQKAWKADRKNKVEDSLPSLPLP